MDKLPDTNENPVVSVQLGNHEGHDYCGDETWSSLRNDHQVLYKYDLPSISKRDSVISVWSPAGKG